MFLRYEKISKKAVKLGSFFQFSVHIFLGHDGCVWKVNWRALWNHIMNIYIEHGQCDSIIFPQIIFFKTLCNCQTFDLLTAGIFSFDVTESIHKFIIKLHVLQCLLVRGSKKKQRRGSIILNFTKRRDFFISYDNQVLLGVISQCGPLSCTLPLPFSFAKKRIYLDTQLKAELTDLFWDRMFSILRSRNRMMNTFIIVSITTMYKEIVQRISLCFSIPKNPSFSLQFG